METNKHTMSLIKILEDEKQNAPHGIFSGAHLKYVLAKWVWESMGGLTPSTQKYSRKISLWHLSTNPHYTLVRNARQHVVEIHAATFGES